MFNDEHCPTLKGKPKIFFIQACRGTKLDHGSDVVVASPINEDKTCSAYNEVKPNRRIRESFDASDTRLGQDSWAASQTGSTGRVVDKIYAPTPHTIVKTPPLKCDNDMLVMFAIPPGMFAWRSTTRGSWMIDYLHQVLMAYDMQQPKNFLNLLTQVAALMSQRETDTPSNPSMHGMKAVSVIEHKLVKAIVFQRKVPFSE